jgi:hypothetical protein
MECIINKVSTSAGDAIIHCNVYPNGSVFLWVFSAGQVSAEDLHIATPDKYSALLALSSRIGDSESRGRGLALRLTKKMGIQCVVSWNIDASVASDVVSTIESEMFNTVERVRVSRKAE